jgi:hypothetical protein
VRDATGRPGMAGWSGSGSSGQPARAGFMLAWSRWLAPQDALNADTIPDAKGTCGWSIKKQFAFGISGAKR